MTKSIIKTDFKRTLTVQEGWMDGGSKHLSVKDTDYDKEINTLLSGDNAKQIATALLPEGSVVVTDLPEAKIGAWDSRVYSGNVDRTIHAEPEKIEQTAKNLLAIAAFIREHNAEKAEAEAAAVAKHEEILKLEQAERESLKARRDALVHEFTGSTSTSYSYASPLAQNAVDRVIELEDAAPKPVTTSMFSL